MDDKDDLVAIPNPVCWCEDCDTFVTPVETKQPLYKELWDARDDNCSDDYIFTGMNSVAYEQSQMGDCLVIQIKILYM